MPAFTECAIAPTVTGCAVVCGRKPGSALRTVVGEDRCTWLFCSLGVSEVCPPNVHSMAVANNRINITAMAALGTGHLLTSSTMVLDSRSSMPRTQIRDHIHSRPIQRQVNGIRGRPRAIAFSTKPLWSARRRCVPQGGFALTADFRLPGHTCAARKVRIREWLVEGAERP